MKVIFHENYNLVNYIKFEIFILKTFEKTRCKIPKMSQRF